MSALLSGLTDRNSVVQKSFAFAMGHLVRVSETLVLTWFVLATSGFGCLCVLNDESLNFYFYFCKDLTGQQH